MTIFIVERSEVMDYILYDTFFKRIFLSEVGKNYMCKILSILFDLDYLDMINNTKIINTEYPRNNIKIKSSMSDAIYKYKNKIFIIEMNKTYTKESLYKNHFYLFYRHIFDAKNENTYNSEMETYLIDIDNYNILNKLKVKDIEESFIYKSKLKINRNYYSIYPNITTVRINLDYLRKIKYNYSALRDIERLCLIFVENDIKILKKEIKYEGIGEIISMFKMVYENGEIYPIFDEEKFHENEKKEMYSQGIEEGMEKGILQGMKKGIIKGREQGILQGQNKKQLEIARNLKLEGFSDEKIMKLTNISKYELKKI